jgi:hypothetical protein
MAKLAEKTADLQWIEQKEKMEGSPLDFALGR